MFSVPEFGIEEEDSKTETESNKSEKAMARVRRNLSTLRAAAALQEDSLQVPAPMSPPTQHTRSTNSLSSRSCRTFSRKTKSPIVERRAWCATHVLIHTSAKEAGDELLTSAEVQRLFIAKCIDIGMTFNQSHMQRFHDMCGVRCRLGTLDLQNVGLGVAAARELASLLRKSSAIAKMLLS